MTDIEVQNTEKEADNSLYSAFYVTERDDMPGQLYFWTRENWKSDIPSEQHELMLEFDKVCAVLRERLQKRSQEQFRDEFRRLLRLAQATFSGEFARVSHGQKSLEAYKIELLNKEGPEIKNEYLKELAKSALIASIIIIIFAVIVRAGFYFGEKYNLIATEASGSYKPEKLNGEKPEELKTNKANAALPSIKWNSQYSPMHFGFLLAATMWGVWLSFAVRNMNLRFEQLQNIESDLMRPWSRLLAVGLLAFILALFFQMQILVISIGGVASTSQISDNLLIAIFVGLCLGFTDKALPEQVQRRIEEFFQTAKNP